MLVFIKYLVCNLQTSCCNKGCFKFVLTSSTQRLWGFTKFAIIECCSSHIYHRCLQHVSFFRLVTDFCCLSRCKNFINITCAYEFVGSAIIFGCYQILRHRVVRGCLVSQACSTVQKIRVCFRKSFSYKDRQKIFNICFTFEHVFSTSNSVLNIEMLKPDNHSWWVQLTLEFGQGMASL